MRYIDHKVIKTALGTFISIYLAEFFNINFGVTAGIVTIISIQATKRESFKIALERFIASLVGLLLSLVFFYFWGYSPIIFGLFVLIFMPICTKFNLIQGFLVTVVLATHILVIEKISMKIFINEILIMILGMGVALILNLYMPDMRKDIRESKFRVDSLMKTLINYFGDVLVTGAVFIDEEELFENLKIELDRGRDMVYKDYNNSLIAGSRYGIELFIMKKNQYNVLLRMRKHFYRFYISSEHAYIISEFTKKVADSIGVDKIYNEVLIDLERIRDIFSKMPLPKSRVEFESRAMFFQFLNDIEEFLELKKEFLKRYTLTGERIK